MLASLERLTGALRQVAARCPWLKQCTIEQYARELHAEAGEVLQAVANRDPANLKEELGDLLWDTLICALLAERAGHFQAHEIVDGVVAKMRRRKPYVFDGTEVTVDEAKRIWAAVKASEKREQRTGTRPPTVVREETTVT